jgi:hypothetical protein
MIMRVWVGGAERGLTRSLESLLDLLLQHLHGQSGSYGRGHATQGQEGGEAGARGQARQQGLEGAAATKHNQVDASMCV